MWGRAHLLFFARRASICVAPWFFQALAQRGYFARILCLNTKSPRRNPLHAKRHKNNTYCHKQDPSQNICYKRVFNSKRSHIIIFNTTIILSQIWSFVNPVVDQLCRLIHYRVNPTLCFNTFAIFLKNFAKIPV